MSRITDRKREANETALPVFDGLHRPGSRQINIGWLCPQCQIGNEWEWDAVDEPEEGQLMTMICDHCDSEHRMRYAGTRTAPPAEPAAAKAGARANPALDQQLAARVAEHDTELAEPALEAPTPDPTPEPTQPERDPGDPYQRALDRLQLTPKLQGADQASQFLRALSLKLQPADPSGDVGARLREIANLLESAA